MGILRVLICLLFPPLAVLDKGCGVLLLVFVLTLFGWIPGVIAALIVCLRQPPTPQQEARESLLGVVAAIVFVTTIALVAIGIFVVGVPHLVQKSQGWLNAQVENIARRSAIESGWQPPSQRPDASWFPAAMDSWTLRTSEDITNVPDIQLERPGRHAKYRGDKQDVDVTVVPVAAEERGAVFDRAETALSEKDRYVVGQTTGNPSFKIESGRSHVMTRTESRFYIKLNGDEHTRLWWLKDWLFVFRTTGPEDPDAFADKYLEAMQP